MNSGYDNTQFYLTTADVARRYGLKPDTVKRWRAKGYGPRYYKADQFARNPNAPRVYYKLEDVIAWERANNIFPTN